MRTRSAPHGLSAALRQWSQPREFRIDPAVWPNEALDALARLARAGGIAGDAKPRSEPSTPEVAGLGIDESTVADVATSLWRLRRRFSTDDAPRSTVRHLEAAWDALTGAGVEIRDHVNDPFDPGLLLNVVAYQPTVGLEREQVIEAIRPSVLFDDRVLQTGEVIVGTPDS